MKYRFTLQRLEEMASNPWLTDREKQVFELFYRQGCDFDTNAVS